MIFGGLGSMSGFLFQATKARLTRAHLEVGQNLTFAGELAGSRWEQYAATTSRPLHDEDPRENPGPYTYPVLCRRSGRRVLLVSPTRVISEYVATELLSRAFTPPLQKVSVDVDTMTRMLVEQPTVYALSFLHVRVPAFGTALRSVSFYGDDIGEASIFRDNIKLMTFFTCGLRHVSTGHEVLRIGSDGAFTFHLGRTTVKDVEEVLKFLRQHGYIDDVLAE